MSTVTIIGSSMKKQYATKTEIAFVCFCIFLMFIIIIIIIIIIISATNNYNWNLWLMRSLWFLGLCNLIIKTCTPSIENNTVKKAEAEKSTRIK